MAKNIRPLSRQELLSPAVTDVDAFTALRYIRHRETVPALPELEDKGNPQLPGFESALLDLYHALWSPEPQVKDQVPPDRQYWQTLLGQAMATSAYQETHGYTSLKEFESVIGTISMAETVLTLVPEKDKKQLQKTTAAQQEANQMQEQSDQAQANADTLQQLTDTAQDAAASGNHPGMSAQEAQARANQLSQQATQAKADAQAAQELAQESALQAEIAAEELLGKPGSEQAEQKLRELTGIGIQALKKTQAKVEELSETIEAWGLEPAELSQQPIPEALALLERMRKNEHMRKFAALLGRVRRIATKKAKNKIAGEGARMTRTETGRDIKRAQRSELVALTSSHLRYPALTRWAHGELRLVSQQTKQKLGHGPVIVCEDGSGSMDGAKQQWAKAVTLSLATYAKLQKRTFAWILFDARVQKQKTFQGGSVSPKNMLDIVEAQAGGGTDFEKPLRAAMELVKTQGLKKADIVFITDGECAVSASFLKEFLAVKAGLDVNIITVLCDVASATAETVKKFSTTVEKASGFTAEEAENKIIKYL